jgi:hypothetical protein
MEKYTTTEIISKIDIKNTAALELETKKITISNDAYALAEAIENLVNVLRYK